ncbi:MAG TPA: chemotaxis protein CheA, partial [Spirochaetota bacterium]|nr:chemotaxis protein CheA [Spirochaetota bacterium]
MGFSLGEYQDIFLEEADEQLQELNQNLLQLEKDPNDSDIINNIFRAAHSLKSSAAFVGLNSLSDLAHKMENLLQGIRDKTMEVTPEIVTVLFRCFDEISSVIGTVASGEEPTQDLSSIISQIQRVHEQAGSGEKKDMPSPQKAVRKQESAVKTKLTVDEMKKIKKGLETGLSCCEVTVFVEQDAMMKLLKARLILNNLEQFSTVVKTVPDLEEAGDGDVDVFRVVILTDQPVDEIRKACDVDQVARVDLRKISLTRKDEKIVIRFHDTETIADIESEQPQEDVEDNDEFEQEDEPAAVESFTDEIHEDDHDLDHIDIHTLSADRKKDDKKAYIIKTVKVSVEKLDLLLNNVGELVIANSGFYKLYEEMRKLNYDKAVVNEFKNRMEQMSRIAKDLQSSIMKTRMVPIGQVFSRFNRLVRDLAIEFDKKLQLKIIGEETELDKKVIDAIGEPLMHLIRNSIDHGVEKTEERRKMNKTEIATITLNAYQGGNQIFVEVSDDGRGLNLQGIKSTAVKRGLATREMLANMDNDDIYNMIFTPGFSTAEEITDISGRGVGMNVVKEIVTELNGNVSIETEPGMGTRFVMAFPLTLAIIPAIMVKVRDEMFAIPLSDVIETIKVSNEDVTTIEGHEVINLRGEILSLIRLNEFVKVETDLEQDQKIPVVVVGFGNRKIGMMVDYLEGKQEIVIKSLEQNYRTVEGLAGASILGDGSICLILDIASMINKVIAEQDVVSRRDRRRVLEGKKIGVVDEQVPVRSLDTTAKLPQPEKERELVPLPEISEKRIVAEKPSVPEYVEKEQPVFKKTESEVKQPERAPESEESGDVIKEEKIYDVQAEEAVDEPEVAEPAKAEAAEPEVSSPAEVSDEDVERRVKEALSQ